jgi:DNA-binding response OmpR family regulator
VKSGRGLTILVVEDAPAIRLRIVAELTAIDGVGRIVEAASCREADTALAEAPPDLAIIDLGLPDGCGLDVVRGIRNAGADASIVVLTNRTSVQYRRASLDAGATFFLDKSIEFHRLAGIVLNRVKL